MAYDDPLAASPLAEARTLSPLPAPPATVPRVAICIPTCGRPAYLAALLDSLGHLTFTGEPPLLRVVIADNNPLPEALSAAEEARRRTGLDVQHVHEPERNIALARNRGVAAALAWGAELVAFVDDDEVVHPDWLDRLLHAQRQWQADVISGQVQPAYFPDTPAWVVRGGFFERPRLESGTPTEFPHMCNALVSARLLRGEGPFDPRLGRTGGSDTLFFTRWHRAGACMITAAEAVAREWVHPTRATMGWILRRAFRVGNTAAAVELDLPRPSRRLGRRAARAALRLALGLALLLPGFLRGRAARARALWSICFGAGFFAGLAGYRYVEYRQVHGA